MIKNLLVEAYQILFIFSCINILNNLFLLGIKIFGRFVLNEDTVFILTTNEKILLGITITLFFSYLT